jgi:hypothetical protein
VLAKDHTLWSIAPADGKLTTTNEPCDGRGLREADGRMEAVRDLSRHEALEFFGRRVREVPDGGPREEVFRLTARSDEERERLDDFMLRHRARSIRAMRGIRRGRVDRQLALRSGGSFAPCGLLCCSYWR